MTKEWSQLPNATHIHWVLETLENDPEVLGSAEKAARDAAWWAARDAARVAAWDAARDAAWDAAWDAARDAIAALVAWDDSSELLDKSVKEVTKLAKKGNHAAVLLLPAVIVKNKLREKNND